MKRSLILAVLFLLPSAVVQGVEAGPQKSQPKPWRPEPSPGRSAAADQRPAPALPQSREEAEPGVASPRPIVRGPLPLAEAEALALRESPVIRGAVAEIDAALARLRMAQAMRRPSVSANTFASVGDAQNILYTAEPVEPRMFMMVPSGLFLNQNVMAMLPLYTSGRLRALTQRAAALRSASRAELEATRQEVVLMTRVAYREAAARRSLIDVAEATVRATDERLRRQRALFEEGRVPLVNVRREEAELANARQQLTNAQRDLELALLQLATVAGLDPESRIEPSEALVSPPETQDETATAASLLPQGFSELHALAREQRPELRAANQRVRSERLAADAARGLYRPQINGMAMADLGVGTSAGFDPNVTVGAVASLPILDGGLRRAQIDEADAMRRRQAAERERIALQVGQEVGSAHANLQAAAQNVATTRTGIVAAEEDYRLALARFEAGRSPLVDVLDAQAALTRARTAEVQARFEYSVARDRLFRAIGAPVGIAAEGGADQAGSAPKAGEGR